MFLVTNYKFPLFSFNKIGLEIMFDKPFRLEKNIDFTHSFIMVFFKGQKIEMFSLFVSGQNRP